MEWLRQGKMCSRIKQLKRFLLPVQLTLLVKTPRLAFYIRLLNSGRFLARAWKAMVDGAVRVDSEADKGTTVTIEIPKKTKERDER